MAQLSEKKVAILATDGFEKAELLDPKKALEQAGAEVTVISLKSGQIKSWSEGNWSDPIQVDLTLDKARPENFDALMLPGGVINPDKLRMEPKAVEFVRSFVDSGKPIAAICHGPQTLINAEGVEGRRMTSWPSLRADLENAGAEWVDEEVVTDQGLVTSRKPADIPAFNRKMIEEFAEGRHQTPQSKAARAEQRPRH
ncbi:type 1 glutamine amidotransferase domain-containing protein [Bdellovibrio sp. 22V]|uniref:type 1 glutamine amidotransferase domain-containing protein n=1 Tax=Bdellovibrio TaxID=958 RepID=UPI002543E4D5|nr:type 1 glutamine amidotransferase domain-containing protein [Bdellovibrio sp. 22V]WII71159.1 type 1 glutamine amidotransferase domain-containing protein [Bdellovibrio sp. 22V]